jgi:hypothetical protein
MEKANFSISLQGPYFVHSTQLNADKVEKENRVRSADKETE